jgi:hypothetical protein
MGNARQASDRRTSSAPTVRDYRTRQMAASRGRARRGSGLFGKLIGVLVGLIVLALIGIAVFFSPLFMIESIQVEGASRLTDERVTELAAVPEGTTLLRVDLDSIRARLETDPWVEAVEVRRAFPSTVVLRITERTIAALVEIPPEVSTATASSWLISTDGIWLGKLDNEAYQAQLEAQGEDIYVEAEANAGTQADEGTEAVEGTEAGEGEDAQNEAAAQDEAATDDGAAAQTEEGSGGAEEGSGGADGEQGSVESQTSSSPAPSLSKDAFITLADVQHLPIIKKVAYTVIPELGKHADDEGIDNALAIINGFSEGMLALVQSIDAPDRAKTMLTLTNHVIVAFGVAEDLEAKETAIRTLLVEHEGSLTYINVRVADRPSIRAAE